MADLCIVVGAQTLAELRERRSRAESQADLVEIRLDTVADPDVAGALAGRTGRVIVTCRAAWEGGYFRGSEEERLRLLEQAWMAGADFVDVEWAARDAAPWTARTAGERLILSAHDFSGTPPDLAALHRAMRQSPAAVVKIAITATTLRETLPLRELAKTSPDRPQVLLAMGAAGIVTRILPDRFGSAWTYAGDDWAPGQVTVDRLRDEFQFGRVSGHAALYGVVARPSSHSVSPTMHNAAFRSAGIDAVYVPFEAGSADDFLAFAAEMNVRGASITLPFKVDLLPRVAADDLARRVGAVNTLARDRSDGWVGTNTDVAGFLAPLAGRIELDGARAAILGAGGAARGAAIALADAGARVVLHARRLEAAREVANELKVGHAAVPPEPGSWDLLVNATSAGMEPHVEGTPWPDPRFDGRLVYDLVYNPPQTRFLREARAAGCETLGGLDMLVAQASAQFELWTGEAPEAGVMHAAAESRLRSFARPLAPSLSQP
jgi:3-dehydroquinate dehydratase / shikimate dehydrogenase